MKPSTAGTDGGTRPTTVDSRDDYNDSRPSTYDSRSYSKPGTAGTDGYSYSNYDSRPETREPDSNYGSKPGTAGTAAGFYDSRPQTEGTDYNFDDDFSDFEI